MINKEKPSINIQDYKPKHLDDILLLMNNIIDSEILEYIKNSENENDVVSILHHSYGSWMRNNWGLWKKESQFTLYFNTIGIFHADDMSSIIIQVIYRHLHNQSINLNKLVKEYRDYWEKEGFDPDKVGGMS